MPEEFTRYEYEVIGDFVRGCVKDTAPLVVRAMVRRMTNVELGTMTLWFMGWHIKVSEVLPGLVEQMKHQQDELPLEMADSAAENRT